MRRTLRVCRSRIPAHSAPEVPATARPEMSHRDEPGGRSENSKGGKKVGATFTEVKPRMKGARDTHPAHPTHPIRVHQIKPRDCNPWAFLVTPNSGLARRLDGTFARTLSLPFFGFIPLPTASSPRDRCRLHCRPPRVRRVHALG